MIYLTGRIMSPGGTRHEHIAEVKWFDTKDRSESWATVPQMVAYIENGNAVQVQGPPLAVVQVRMAGNGYKFLQTKADGVWTNNLLALPAYTRAA